MITEKLTHRFDNLLQAIEEIKTEGYIIKFISSEPNSLNPKTKNTYFPENLSSVEIIRMYPPFADLDGDNNLYLLETDDAKKGWTNDSYSIYADINLSEHINSIRAHFSPTNYEL